MHIPMVRMMKLEQLRQKISKIERRVFQPVVGRDDTCWRFGCSAIDQALPGGRLAQNGLHDFSVQQARDTPAMGRFVLALLRRFLMAEAKKELGLQGEIIWCQSSRSMREHGHPYGPGLKAMGLAPERLVIVSLRKEKDLAFVMEESLRSGAVTAVIGEGAPVGFTASRRLSLACQEMTIPCLFLNSTGRPEASAAATRWRIAPAIGPPDESDPHGPGPASWSVVLTRARGGRAHLYNRPWNILWNDETHSFNLVSPLGNGTLANHPPESPPLHAPGDEYGLKRKVS